MTDIPRNNDQAFHNRVKYLDQKNGAEEPAPERGKERGIDRIKAREKESTREREKRKKKEMSE